MYLIKTPRFIKKIFSSFVWDIKTNEKVIYLTFDDGPHASITPFVLDALKKYNAKATFFCIGKNVEQNLEVYERIINDGHCLGNHTYNHLNGWHSDLKTYIEDTEKASLIIKSNLFRPPYGKITKSQSRELIKLGYKIIMWDVLSGDFDINLNKEKCLQSVKSKTKAGSIIVFHDSEKAFEKLNFVLPLILKHFNKEGYNFQSFKKII